MGELPVSDSILVQAQVAEDNSTATCGLLGRCGAQGAHCPHALQASWGLPLGNSTWPSHTN
jgi:hypothetical protein